MTVLIFGSHKVSEPLAFDVGEEIVANPGLVRGVENPNWRSSDWICLVEKYIEELMRGRPYPEDFHGDFFMNFAMREQGDDICWIQDVVEQNQPERVYDLHSMYDGHGRCQESQAIIEVRDELDGRGERFVKKLARKYNVQSVIVPCCSRDARTIEIVLPHTVPKRFGVQAKYLPILTRLAQYSPEVRSDLRSRWSSRHSAGELERAIELAELREQTGPFLVIEKESQEYASIKNAASGFLTEYFKSVGAGAK